jgi:hypothetical protein
LISSVNRIRIIKIQLNMRFMPDGDSEITADYGSRLRGAIVVFRKGTDGKSARAESTLAQAEGWTLEVL